MSIFNSVQKPKSFFNKKVKLVLAALAAIVILLIVARFATGALDALTGDSSSSVDVNKSFTSTALTNDGRRTDGTLPVKITTANLDDNILVQGSEANTRNGKLFLIVYLEIENKYKVTLYSKPVDLLRLVRSDGKRIAPSVSQGDTQIRPLSVKRTNVAFVVDPGEKSFTIEAGEVSGSKEAVQINFK